MAIVAPKARKHLSAAGLFRLVRSGFATIPELRGEDGDIALRDVLRAVFAMFSLKAPSLLAFDKERAEGNVPTIYGIQQVPCDTYRRERLDPRAPKWLRPVFKSVLRQLQRGKALEERVFLDGHDLLALDGTRDFSSTSIHWASCLHTGHRNGAVSAECPGGPACQGDAYPGPSAAAGHFPENSAAAPEAGRDERGRVGRV